MRMSGHNASEIAELNRKIAEGVPRRVAEIAAQIRNADYPGRKAIEKTVASTFDHKIIELSRVSERLALLIRTKYMEVAESLTREFRIFTGANALVFAHRGVTVLIRKRARLQLALPAFVLLGAASVVGYLYIFKQNWLHSILFSEYLGLAYFGYLGAAVTLLADIVFNRACITTKLLNAAFQSMRTADAYLRKGVASQMLRHLIEEAQWRGYRRLRLETGSMAFFEPARKLYSGFGFAYCGPFADYVEDPNSVFMTREF